MALVRSLLPGGPTLLKPETLAQMMTNQLPDGVWMRFPVTGELVGKGYGLAGAVTVQPAPYDHADSRDEFWWAAWPARNGGFRPKPALPAC